MSITITKQWLKDNGADSEPIEWFERQTETDPIKLSDIALDDDHFDYINWVITRKMNRSQFKVAYAIFAAELVLNIFTTKFPTDDRPRKAIEAAKAYLVTTDVADAANAYVAHIAAHAAVEAAKTAHVDAAHAAHAAAHAAHVAANAADAAVDIVDTVDAVAHVAGAAGYAVKKQIIRYGISLLTE